ncbi:MAG: 7-carboxy-7-deazaguanine synthase QueE [Phycisphaerales bacterium]|nr:7-carboxy-7-deazaguanine synthase QueE [Phycisphaerales bacterium]
MTLPISETFTSIQGEGALTGVPSHFIRTSGCNLRCTWCDTPYASWSPESTTRAIDDLVAEADASGVDHVVVTGGEPMMHDAIVDLCQALGQHVTIETAGTIHRPPIADLLSISPKLASSTPTGDPRDPSGAWATRHESRRLDLGVLRRLIDEAAEVQVKFVVCDESDLEEIDGLVDALGIGGPHVMLMPEGALPAPGDLQRMVARACVSRGWRYSHRVHVDLWGDERGR